MIYEVGPESGTYHTYQDCPALHRANRYWGVKARNQPSPSNHFSNRGWPRRLCKLCEKRMDE